MKLKNNDTLRNNYTIFLEPFLATKATEASNKIGCKTRSKYIRYAVINQLIMDGYKLTDKYKPFYDNLLNKRMTYKG